MSGCPFARPCPMPRKRAGRHLPPARRSAKDHDSRDYRALPGTSPPGHQIIRLSRIQKWLPHRSGGTQIEGNKVTRPRVNESFHGRGADGIRQMSTLSPHPHGQHKIAHLYRLGSPITYKQPGLTPGRSFMERTNLTFSFAGRRTTQALSLRRTSESLNLAITSPGAVAGLLSPSSGDPRRSILPEEKPNSFGSCTDQRRG